MKIGGYVESDVSSFIHRMLPNKTIKLGKVVNLFMCAYVCEREREREREGGYDKR